MPHDLKFVWPKDGYKGRSGPRGFFGRLNDIMTCRGPDIFIQRKKSTTPIKPDFWGNWFVLYVVQSIFNTDMVRDSYHLQAAHIQEVSGPGASRGFKRYDPYSRKYVQWTIPHDWDGLHSREKVYPRFTTDEWEDMASRVRRGRAPKPSSMGSGWHHEGPKVCFPTKVGTFTKDVSAIPTGTRSFLEGGSSCWRKYSART